MGLQNRFPELAEKVISYGELPSPSSFLSCSASLECSSLAQEKRMEKVQPNSDNRIVQVPVNSQP